MSSDEKLGHCEHTHTWATFRRGARLTPQVLKVQSVHWAGESFHKPNDGMRSTLDSAFWRRNSTRSLMALA
jgi:hypothetical protein